MNIFFLNTQNILYFSYFYELSCVNRRYWPT